MATFNPEVGGIPSPNMPDQTGASRGTTPNRAFEYLFSGIGDAVGGIANAVDSDIKKTITNETRKGFDGTIGVYTDTVPSELQQAGSAIKNLQSAFNQGKISDVYYYGQLTNMLKKMRSKYPGYEDFVDNTIQDITGVRPANAYREALMQEFNSQASTASDGEKFWRQWEKDNEEYITRIAGDYFDNPSKYPREVIRSEVAKLKGKESEVQAAKANIELALSNNTLNDQQASEAAVTTLNNVVSTNISNMSNIMGLSSGNLLDTVNKLNTSGYSPEEYTQIVNGINQMEVQLKLALNKALTDPLSEGSTNSFSSILPGKNKELIEQAMAPFLAIKEMVMNKEMGMAGYYTRLNQMRTDKETARIIDASPDLLTATALRDISPDLATDFLNNDGKIVGIYKSIAPELSARIVNGSDSLNSVIDRIVSSNVQTQEKVGLINSTLDNLKSTITLGVATPSQVKTTVQALYGLDSSGKNIFSYIDPSQYKTLYDRMFNEEITKAISSVGDKESLSTYFKSAYDRMFSVPEFQRASATFDKESNPWYEVTVDPATNRFAVVVSQGAKDNLGPNVIEAMSRDIRDKSIVDGVNTVNSVLDTIAKIAEASGVSKAELPALYERAVKDMNIKLENGSKDSFFSWLLKAVGLMAKEQEGAAKGDTQKTSRLNFSLPTTDTADSTDLSGYYNATRNAESGGNDSAANPSSTSSGRYGFLDSTWNVYARRLGLTDKNNPQQQDLAMQAFTADNQNVLISNGIPVTNSSLYAAHFLGSGAAVDVLQSDDASMMSDLVSQKVLKANNFLVGMTVGDFKQWLASKVG